MTQVRRTTDCADLHVMMTADAVGGVFSYITTLSRELCARGARVTLVLQGPAASADKRDSLAQMPGVDVIATDLDLEWLDPDGRDFTRALQRLEAIARTARPDVMHFNGFREARADVRAPRVLVAHSCVPSWWRACRGTSPDAAWDRYEANLRAGLDAADAWAAPSRWYRDAIEAVYRPRLAGDVIHNGIVPRAAGSSSKAVVLAAGRMWDEAKDLETLARAAEDIDWPVEIAGPLHKAGEAISVDTGAARLLGALPSDALAQGMSEAGIFVSSAVYEPFGLAVLEAAASGCALVLADIESFRELWDDAALYFAPRDAAGLARAANRLIADAALRRHMRDRAIARAQRYTASRMCDETVALYRSVLTHANAGINAEVAA